MCCCLLHCLGCFLGCFFGAMLIFVRVRLPTTDAGSKLGLGEVQAELDRISSRETDSDLSNANDAPATDGQDTWSPSHFSHHLSYDRPPPSSHHAPPLPLHHKDARGKLRGGCSFSSSFTFSSRKNRLHSLPSPTTLLLGCYTKGLVFVTFTCKSVCYMKIWGRDGGLRKGILRLQKNWKCGCLIHPFTVMVQLVFLL